MAQNICLRAPVHGLGVVPCSFTPALAILRLGMDDERVLMAARCGVWHGFSDGFVAVGDVRLSLPGNWCPIEQLEDNQIAIALVPPARGAGLIVAVAGTISAHSDPETAAVPAQTDIQGVKRKRLGLPTPIEIDGHHGFRATYAPEAGATEESLQMFWLFPSADFSLLAPDVPAELAPFVEELVGGLSVSGRAEP